MSLNEKSAKRGAEAIQDEAGASPTAAPAKARSCFVLSCKYNPGHAAEPISTKLATHRAAVVQAEKVAAGFVKRYPQIRVEVGNPVLLGDRDVAFNFILWIESKEPELIAASARIEEIVRSELRSIEVATSLMRAGHLALTRIIDLGLPDMPQVKAGPANQTEIARIGADGSVFVTVTSGLDDVRAHRSLLKAFEAANTCGLRISAKLKDEVFGYEVLPPGATKPDWIAAKCSTQIGKITGILEKGRLVELAFGKIVRTLGLKHDNCPEYLDAFRKSRYVRFRLKTSRPGNPFQIEEPKFSLDETIEFMDDDGQTKIDLRGGQEPSVRKR